MNKKLLIDLDGTLVNGLIPINQSSEFLQILEKNNIEFLVMTNSIKSPMAIKSRLSGTGIEIPLFSIINPIVAINSYLARNNFNRALIVGSEQEKLQVRAAHDLANPEIILLLDFEKRNYSFSDLQDIYELIQRGIPIIAASGSPFYKSGDVNKLDTGAFVSLFEHAGNIKIEIFGKPSEYYYKEALEILDCRPDEVLAIGDDWKTDAQGAISSGFNAILVRSGKYQDRDEDKLPGVRSINSLLEVLDYIN